MATTPLALTLGEPAGIGPDITLLAWVRREELKLPPFYVLGDRRISSRAAPVRSASTSPLQTWTPTTPVAAFVDALPVVATGKPATAEPGRPMHPAPARPSPRSGRP